MLFQNDLSVGRHERFKFTSGVVDGNSHLEGGHVVFLNPHRRDLCDFATEALVFERLNFDASGLSEIDLADIAFVDFAVDIDLLHVAKGHDQRRRGT